MAGRRIDRYAGLLKTLALQFGPLVNDGMPQGANLLDLQSLLAAKRINEPELILQQDSFNFAI